MSEGMFGGGNPATKGNVDAGNVDSENDSNGSGSSPAARQFDEQTVQKMIQDRLASQSKRHAKERAEYEERLAALEGGHPHIDDDEKKPAPKPIEAEYKNKLTKVERENKALLEKLNKHRTSTLRSTVQSKLAAADCLDPEVAFNDIVSRGLVKLDDDDNVVTEGLYDSLDQLVEDYLSKRDYMRRSKVGGGIGSKAPGISATSVSQRDQVISQVRAAQQGKKLFGR